MADFSLEQQAILKHREQTYLSYLKSLHEALEEYGYRVAAIVNVLHAKGLATPQELDAVEEEIRAAVMIEKAVNPTLRAAEDTLRSLLDGR